MAKADNPVAAAQASQPAPDTFSLGLDEFCSRLSQTDKRVELIGAFHHIESIEGRTKDTSAAFAARFAAFANRPV